MNTIRVVLADDNSAIRLGLEYFLGKDPGIAVVGSAANGMEALERVRALSPDVLLLDIRMPVLDGFGVVEELTRLRSTVPILVLTVYENQEFIDELLKHDRVVGILTKDEEPRKILEAVHRAASGERGIYSERIKGKVLLEILSRSRRTQSTE